MAEQPPAGASAPPPEPPKGIGAKTWGLAKRIVPRFGTYIKKGFVVVGAFTVLSWAVNSLLEKRLIQLTEEALKDNPNKKILLQVNLDSIVESKTDAQRFIGDRFGITAATSLYELHRALEIAKSDSRVVGIVGTSKNGTNLGIASTQEFEKIIKNFRENGKPAWAHVHSVLGAKHVSMLSAFDKTMIIPGGVLFMSHLATTQLFLKSFLRDTLGVRMQFEKRSEYKNAPNPLIEDDFTPEHREATVSILSSLNRQVIDSIAKNRKIDPEKVEQFLTNGLFIDSEAVDLGLIDGICHRNQIEYDFSLNKLVITPMSAAPKATTFSGWPIKTRGFLAKLFFGSPPTPMNPDQRQCFTVPLSKYLRLDVTDMKIQFPDIAVVFADGTIHGERDDGKSSEDGISDLAMAKSTLRLINRTPSIKTVVLHISSPGGDAHASEAIWADIKKAQALGRKVIVSMGETAASGGYYIAAPADRIFALEGTVTGSIGTFAGKPLISDLMNKLGINISSISMNNSKRKQSGDEMEYLFSPFHSWEGRRKEAVAKLADRAYSLFKSRVAEGRKMTVENVEKIARGRVWTGLQAKEIGLVDEIGGLQDAINYAKLSLKNPDAKVQVINVTTYKTIAMALLNRSSSFYELVRDVSSLYTEAKASIDSGIRIEARTRIPSSE